MKKYELSVRDFYNIEIMLNNKTILENRIIKQLKQIEEYENGGRLDISRKNFVERVQGTNVFKSELDIRFELINNLRLNLLEDQKRLDDINTALNVVENDKYYSIIELKYFKQKTINEICVTLNLSRDTFFRHRIRLFKLIHLNLPSLEKCPLCNK